MEGGPLSSCMHAWGLTHSGPDRCARRSRSQFFITLSDCEWLNNKHTIFAKVRVHACLYGAFGLCGKAGLDRLRATPYSTCCR
jgi:cyclophilin family peptidyl-prolyl cis-trans isomerase